MSAHPVGALSVHVAPLLTDCPGAQTLEPLSWCHRFKLLERFYPMRALQIGADFLIELAAPTRSIFQFTFFALLLSLSACGGGQDVESQPSTAKAFALAFVPSNAVVFQRPKQDYTIQKTADGFAVTDKVGTEGTKNVSAIAKLQFADQSVALEDDGQAAQVYRLYKAAFNRVPDLDGLGYWINQMDQGASLLEVANAFVRSAEFASIYGAAPTNAQIVDRYYTNLRGRAGDEGGITYWNKLLNDRSATTADVLVSFSNSAENKNLLSESLAMGVSHHAVGVSYQDPVKVTLFGINDLHGNLLPPSGSVTVADPANLAGTRVSAGGLAYMARQ